MQPNTILKLTDVEILNYLDDAIEFWRDSYEPYAGEYVDAFQSVRVTLFGNVKERP